MHHMPYTICGQGASLLPFLVSGRHTPGLGDIGYLCLVHGVHEADLGRRRRGGRDRSWKE